eukprot:jgi/Chrzof1/496/Cz01g17260.t1
MTAAATHERSPDLEQYSRTRPSSAALPQARPKFPTPSSKPLLVTKCLIDDSTDNSSVDDDGWSLEGWTDAPSVPQSARLASAKLSKHKPADTAAIRTSRQAIRTPGSVSQAVSQSIGPAQSPFKSRQAASKATKARRASQPTRLQQRNKQPSRQTLDVGAESDGEGMSGSHFRPEYLTGNTQQPVSLSTGDVGGQPGLQQVHSKQTAACQPGHCTSSSAVPGDSAVTNQSTRPVLNSQHSGTVASSRYGSFDECSASSTAAPLLSHRISSTGAITSNTGTASSHHNAASTAATAAPAPATTAAANSPLVGSAPTAAPAPLSANASLPLQPSAQSEAPSGSRTLHTQCSSSSTSSRLVALHLPMSPKVKPGAGLLVSGAAGSSTSSRRSTADSALTGTLTGWDTPPSSSPRMMAGNTTSTSTSSTTTTTTSGSNMSKSGTQTSRSTGGLATSSVLPPVSTHRAPNNIDRDWNDVLQQQQPQSTLLRIVSARNMRKTNSINAAGSGAGISGNAVKESDDHESSSSMLPTHATSHLIAIPTPTTAAFDNTEGSIELCSCSPGGSISPRGNLRYGLPALEAISEAAGASCAQPATSSSRPLMQVTPLSIQSSSNLRSAQQGGASCRPASSRSPTKSNSTGVLAQLIATTAARAQAMLTKDLRCSTPGCSNDRYGPGVDGHEPSTSTSSRRPTSSGTLARASSYGVDSFDAHGQREPQLASSSRRTSEHVRGRPPNPSGVGDTHNGGDDGLSNSRSRHAGICRISAAESGWQPRPVTAELRQRLDPAGTAHLPRQLYNDGVAAAQEWSNRRKSIDELLNRLLEQQHSAAAAQVRPHTRRAGATRSGRLIKVGKSLL